MQTIKIGKMSVIKVSWKLKGTKKKNQAASIQQVYETKSKSTTEG